MAEYKYYDAKKAREFTDLTAKIIEFIYQEKRITVPSLQDKFDLSYAAARDIITTLCEIEALNTVDALTFEVNFKVKTLNKIKEINEKYSRPARRRRFYFGNDNEDKIYDYGDFYDKLKKEISKYINEADDSIIEDYISDINKIIADNLDSIFSKPYGSIQTQIRELKTFVKYNVSVKDNRALLSIDEDTPRFFVKETLNDFREYLSKNEEKRKCIALKWYRFSEVFLEDIGDYVDRETAKVLAKKNSEFEVIAKGYYDKAIMDKATFDKAFDKSMEDVITIVRLFSKERFERGTPTSIGGRFALMEELGRYLKEKKAKASLEENEDKEDDNDDNDEDIGVDDDDIGNFFGEDDDDEDDSENDDESDDDNDDEDDDKDSDNCDVVDEEDDNEEDDDGDGLTIPVSIGSLLTPAHSDFEYFLLLERLKRSCTVSIHTIVDKMKITDRATAADYEALKNISRIRNNLEDETLICEKIKDVNPSFITNEEKSRPAKLLDMKDNCDKKYLMEFEKYYSAYEIKDSLPESKKDELPIAESLTLYDRENAKNAYESIKNMWNYSSDFYANTKKVVEEYIKNDPTIDPEKLKVYYFMATKYHYVILRINFPRKELVDALVRLYDNYINGKTNEEIAAYIAEVKKK